MSYQSPWIKEDSQSKPVIITGRRISPSTKIIAILTLCSSLIVLIMMILFLFDFFKDPKIIKYATTFPFIAVMMYISMRAWQVLSQDD